MEKYNFYVFGMVYIVPLLAAAVIPAMRVSGVCNFLTGTYKLIKERP
jgi:hypothetical protein